MATSFQLFCKRLSLLPALLAVTALFLLMVMTFSDVIMRSLFNSPIEAATELTRIFMAIIVFSSLPVISAKGTHIVVDLIDPLFRGIAIRIRDGVIDILAGGLMVWPTMRCFTLADRAKEYGDLTEYLAIPQFYIAYFIAVASALTALVLLVKGVLTLVKPSLISPSSTMSPQES